MAVVSTPDVNLIRGAKRIRCEPVLNVVPLVEVASAEIASAPTYPMTQLAVTSATGWENTDIGRAFAVEDAVTGKIKTWGVQRKLSTSSVFFPDVKSLGDAGYATDIMTGIVAGDILHVYQHRPIWGYISRATADGAFKAWDIAYEGSGSTPYPIVNMGSHRQAWDDGSGGAEFTLDCSASYDWFLGTSGIASVLWILPGAATITGGVEPDQIINVYFPNGAYEIACRVTSVNGRSFTGYRWVFVNSRNPGDPTAPFSARHPIEAIASDIRHTTGREMTFTVRGDARDEIYPGMSCLFTNRIYYDGQELDEAVVVKNFVGYLEEGGSTGQRKSLSASLTFYGPIRLAARTPTATQLVEESTSPGQWTEVLPGLSDPAYVAAYIMTFHTSLTINHDFVFDGYMRFLRRQVFGFRQENIGAQMKFLGELSTGEITCRSDGTVRFIRVPDLLEANEKNLLDEKFTWTEADIDTPVQIDPKLRPDIAYMIMDAISYDGGEEPATYRAIAPGFAQMQGLSKSDAPDIIVPSLYNGATGQTILERTVGHQVAYANNPLSDVPLASHRMIDIWEPADDDWHLLDVDSQYLAFDPDLFVFEWQGGGSGVRFRPTKVTMAWEKNERGIWFMRPQCTARFMSHGTPGVFLPVEEGGAADPEDGWLPEVVYPPETSPPGDLGEDYAFALVWNEPHGRLGRSATFLNAQPTFNPIDSSFGGGKVIDACWDVQAADLAAYALVWDASVNALRVYRSSNVELPTPAWSLLLTISTNASSNARIANSSTITCVAWLRADGVRAARRSGFSAWGTTVMVGPGGFSDPDHANEPLGLAVDGSNQYVSSLSGDGEWKLYTASGTGSFSEVTGMPSDDNVSFLPMSVVSRDSSKTYVSLGLLVDTPGVETIGDLTATPLDKFYPPIPPFSGPNISNQASAINQAVRYGVAQMYSTTEAVEQGIRYKVSDYDFQFQTEVWYLGTDGDPPGTSGTPQFFPPGNGSGPTYEFYKVEVTAQVWLLDEELKPLWYNAHSFHSLSLDEFDWDIVYSPSPASFDKIHFTVTARMNGSITPSIEGVKYILMRFTSDNLENFGAGETLGQPRFSMFRGLFQMDINGKVQDGRRLFRISSGPTWTDITPDDDYMPRIHNAITIDNSDLMMIGSNPQGTARRLISATDGGSWSNEGGSPHKWVKKLDTGIYILGGSHRLDMTANDFDTLESRLGSWAQTMGPIGTIRNALVKVEKA